ncbi:MAG: thiol:disulfide interchange protein DsbG [Micavibrio aeruginosavorus]|uniref:Thiol:disulfide interchange protein DsbG n=1 Tax=Micavibrio aeruginosavorus TaxID=349221 RepID=A0A2W5A3J9_9BACT|nr:MAG: thiol:disulfide interchange protein DsbG [Micavibrio aeruginosavorus]
MRFFLLAAALLTLAAPSFAQTSLPALPESLQALADRGAQMRYLGTQHGMDGWIAIYQGQEQYYYVTPDKKAFVTGLMFGNEGEPITVDQVRELQAQGGPLLDLLAEGEAPSATPPAAPESVSSALNTKTPAERMFTDVQSANTLRLGKANAPVVYSFIDPQCPHCHKFINELKKDYLDKGLVQVRLIPVGFIEGSLPQAAFLLAAPDGEQRFYKHLAGDKDAIPAKSDISTQSIQKNMAVMQAWKFNVTPLTVYRSRTGEVKIIRGAVKDIPGMIADLPSASTPAVQ